MNLILKLLDMEKFTNDIKKVIHDVMYSYSIEKSYHMMPCIHTMFKSTIYSPL
jgi:hypothetical protein